jgi:hypothetical protein
MSQRVKQIDPNLKIFLINHDPILDAFIAPGIGQCLVFWLF